MGWISGNTENENEMIGGRGVQPPLLLQKSESYVCYPYGLSLCLHCSNKSLGSFRTPVASLGLKPLLRNKGVADYCIVKEKREERTGSCWANQSSAVRVSDCFVIGQDGWAQREESCPQTHSQGVEGSDVSHSLRLQSPTCS